MRIIKREDIVGAHLVDIHETYEMLEGGSDCRVVYFTVDRHFSFVTPSAGEPWTTLEVPANAAQLPDEFVSESFAAKPGLFGDMKIVRLPSTTVDEVKQMKQRLIAGVYCAPMDERLGFYCPDEGILVFEDGSQAWNPRVAPSGTGAAGLHFYPKGSADCIPVEELVDYFTIPGKEGR